MPVPETAEIVARFLKSNHYNETLSSFINEAGLPRDAGCLKPGDWTIEQILLEKKQFDTSLNFEKTGSHEVKGWSAGAPQKPHTPKVDITSNVLSVNADPVRNVISFTCADKSWKDVSSTAPFEALIGSSHVNDSPVLFTQLVGNGTVLSTSMSGYLSLRNAETHRLLDECRHHSKYVVQCVSAFEDDLWVAATVGWDQKIHFYAPDKDRIETHGLIDTSDSYAGLLGNPFHTESLASNPESMIFVRHPDTHELYLVVSRRDSTHLYYYRISGDGSGGLEVEYTGRQNLAPHSNAWVAFTPCNLAPCPTDPTLLAVATSHLPHMKLIVVRLLFPSAGSDHTDEISATPAAVARADLALQDKEDAAINLQVTTLAPQTPYSTPKVVWRPDGSGVFVNGDDGVIRGVETTSGKVITLLKGHEAGSKVRTLWAGRLKIARGGEPQEVLISGGFDKKLLVWTA